MSNDNIPPVTPEDFQTYAKRAITVAWQDVRAGHKIRDSHDLAVMALLPQKRTIYLRRKVRQVYGAAFDLFSAQINQRRK